MYTKISKKLKLAKFGIIPAALILVCAVGAFANTHSDYDKRFDFAKLKTWDFANSRVNTSDEAGKNPIWDTNLRGDVTANLQSAGFMRSSDNPDFIVRFHLGTREKVRTEVIRDEFPGFAYARRGWIFWRGGWNERTVFRTPYDQSTLVVDIVDARTKEIVWRGYDTQTIDLDRSDKTLSKATEKLVDNFRRDARKEEKRMG